MPGSDVLREREPMSAAMVGRNAFRLRKTFGKSGTSFVPHSRRGHNRHFLGPHLKRTLQAADIFRPTREFNMKDAHNKAAEQHETAAKSHRAAADAHDKNDHTKGKEYSTQAQQHAQNANDQSKAAHAKSQQQK